MRYDGGAGQGPFHPYVTVKLGEDRVRFVNIMIQMNEGEILRPKVSLSAG